MGIRPDFSLWLCFKQDERGKQWVRRSTLAQSWAGAGWSFPPGPWGSGAKRRSEGIEKGGSVVRRILFVACACAVALAMTVPAQAVPSIPPHGAICELTGTANFGTGTVGTKPGLTAKPSKNIVYSFSGTFSNCRTSITAADHITPTVYPTSVTATGSAKSGKAGLACEGGDSAGTATITNNNGTQVKVNFSTAGPGALTLVQGSVSSVTGTAATNYAKANDKAAAALVFQTTTPQACATTSGPGLMSATFTGVAGA